MNAFVLFIVHAECTASLQAVFIELQKIIGISQEDMAAKHFSELQF
jgi:hypothetical protein